MSTSTMFMNWKVPTRLIVDEPSYHQQKQKLLADSTQKFYEDINGSKKYPSPTHDVLSEVTRLRQLPHGDISVGPTRYLARTSTTHHCPPQGMLKQMREKDIDDECWKSMAGGRKPTPRPGGPKLPQMMSGKIHQNPTKQSMARSLRPRAMPAAEQWLQGAGAAEKQVVGDALQAADNDFVDKTLARTLQPDAKKAVQKWLQTATDKDRDVAIEFFGSLAGGKLMGASGVANHALHKDEKGGDTCRICDGDRLNQVLDALKRGNPVAAVTLRKDLKPGDMRRRHIRLLTPQTRATKEEQKTWHHLPVYRNTGPVSNTIALFTRPHRPIPRHFTIHPEWE
ncbi:uncharacterized protein [Amphiura filiformis]|uniref:uncharacterized protein n=1 Tax=Amphiura filiformis TaxID=82378 RepID=UPI003B2197A6